MDFPELLKADKGIEELLYSFALIFSRDRPNHHDKKREYASGQVTACALRETPRAGGAADAKIYYLIVAKNDQFDMKDRKHMSEVGDWISGPNEIDDSIYQSLIGYLGNRVQSYLDSVSKELQHPTRSSKWSTEQFETVRSLYNVHNTFALPRASWTLEDRCASLRTAAEFVTHNQDRIERSFSSLRDHQDVVNRIWDKVERLSRVGLAIECLERFRKHVMATRSIVKIIQVKKDQNKRFSEDITFAKVKATVIEYNRRIKRAEQEVLQLNDENILDHGNDGSYEDSTHTSLRYVHCEIQLLEHLLIKDQGKGLNSVYDYIGCSKEPCWLCDVVIRTATRFRMTTSHGGIYWNWTLSEALYKLAGTKKALKEADEHMLDTIRQARLVFQTNSVGF